MFVSGNLSVFIIWFIMIHVHVMRISQITYLYSDSQIFLLEATTTGHGSQRNLKLMRKRLHSILTFFHSDKRKLTASGRINFQGFRFTAVDKTLIALDKALFPTKKYFFSYFSLEVPQQGASNE